MDDFNIHDFADEVKKANKMLKNGSDMDSYLEEVLTNSQMKALLRFAKTIFHFWPEDVTDVKL